jgi:predicted DCC family thiol-disulfide oxidoreductase YuxK
MGAPRYEIAIDSHCGFCKKSAGWLKSLDWRDAVRIQPVDEPGMREMRVQRLSDKHTLGGFDGFRLMAKSIPLLVPLWPFLFVPGVPWAGRKAYRWIADHRSELPGGCESDVCALPDPPSAKKP